MQLLEMMANNLNSVDTCTSCMECAMDFDAVLEKVDIPSDFTKEVKNLANTIFKMVGSDTENSKSFTKLNKKLEKAPRKNYGFGERNIKDIKADSINGKIKSLGYKCSVNVDKNPRVITKYYVKKLPDCYINLIVSTSTPENKKGENEFYIICKYVDEKKVDEQTLKLFK